MKAELKVLLKSTIYPTIFVITLILIWFVDKSFGLDLARFGLKPFTPEGLIGIITAPLLHSDFEHLISNIVPLYILSVGLFYYYVDCAKNVTIFCYLLTGMWTWFMGRGTGIHIGASGVVDALITFHLISSFLRKRRDLEAYSLIIILLYGGFIWGFFPDFFPGKNISWQSHLCGAMAGVVAAFYFKESGPQRIEWEWDEDDDDEENDDSVDGEVGNENDKEKKDKIDNCGEKPTVSGDENEKNRKIVVNYTIKKH